MCNWVVASTHANGVKLNEWKKVQIGLKFIHYWSQVCVQIGLKFVYYWSQVCVQVGLQVHVQLE